jgi:hypothetical protein
MKFIALDLELNGASQEIIQIGIVAFDTDTGCTSSFNVYVDQPNVDFEQMLSCGVTLKQYLCSSFIRSYENGKLLKSEAAYHLNAYLKNTEGCSCVVQWGSADYKILTAQFQTVFTTPDIINVQTLYKRLYAPAAKLPKTGGLRSAAERLNLIHMPHDALSDANVTGHIYLQMFEDLQQFTKIKKIIQ